MGNSTIWVLEIIPCITCGLRQLSAYDTAMRAGRPYKHGVNTCTILFHSMPSKDLLEDMIGYADLKQLACETPIGLMRQLLVVEVAAQAGYETLLRAPNRTPPLRDVVWLDTMDGSLAFQVVTPGVTEFFPGDEEEAN